MISKSRRPSHRRRPATLAVVVGLAIALLGVGTATPTMATAEATTVAAAPAVTGVSPSSGTAAGGTTVTLSGRGFTGTTKVLFGLVAGTDVTVVSDSTITVVSPAEAPGVHNIYVTTPVGTSPAVSADVYTLTGPIITGVAPPSGRPAGGTAVTLTGRGFTGTTKVMFGTVAATSVTVVSDSTITLRSPAEAPGVHNIYVTTPVGTSPAAAADLYTFTAPGIEEILPTSGPFAGGNTVTVNGDGLGNGFAGTTKVMFGTVPGTSIKVVNDYTITVTAPAEPPGVHNVFVTTPVGTTPATPGDLYTYTGPTVTGVSPSVGTSTGGTTVTLTGSGFTGTTKVLFGSTAGTNVTVVNDSTITVVSPPEPPIGYNIFVTTPVGTSLATQANMFQVNPPQVFAISPSSGPSSGGTTVTVTGSAFTGATTVTFGTVAGTDVTVVNDSTITVVAPAEAPGVHTVYVTTPIGGTSPAGYEDQYTFT
jgi:hypothetical protein